MSNTPTKAREVYESFEASFQDKKIIPDDLKLVWLLKAIARYSVELDELVFNKSTLSFDRELDRYVVDTLAAFMKQSYQEREVSKVNKRISIVGKDLSIDGSNGTKKYAKDELTYDNEKSQAMVDNQMPTAYI